MAQEGGPWAKGWQVGQKDMGSVCSATSVLLYLIVYIHIYIWQQVKSQNDVSEGKDAGVSEYFVSVQQRLQPFTISHRPL